VKASWAIVQLFVLAIDNAGAGRTKRRKEKKRERATHKCCLHFCSFEHLALGLTAPEYGQFRIIKAAKIGDFSFAGK
jgi:hypothetical protein